MLCIRRLYHCLFLVICWLPLSAVDPSPAAAALDAYDVRWDVPGPGSQESMPIGNGDIGLNLWTEANGDVVFYIGKTDAWGGDVKGSRGLPKVGRVRISFEPKQLAPGMPFLQLLKLRDGEIRISEGSEASGTTLRVWVDANHPVIRVEAASHQSTTLTVTCEDWHKGEAVVPGQEQRVVWYRRNGPKSDTPVVNLTSGAAITGPGLVGTDGRTLHSSTPTTSHRIAIHPLTATTATIEEWQQRLDQQIAATDQVALESSRQAHQAWWHAFWDRSWVFINGDQMATDVTRGYLLQRFVTACAGRGAYPIKFNGSIFTVDDPYKMNDKTKQPTPVEADYRDWGGQYWFQNTRPMYWPRLVAGDFDLMQPLFRMYAAITATNAAQVKAYYKHEGSYFAETAPFWGGLKYVGPEVPENWTDHYFTPILELSMMMLDYYDFTGDQVFVRETLVPVAAAGVMFFDQHFTRDAQGKLLLDPDNAIEMYWKAHNPAPDIAGLRAVLPRLLALPDSLTTAPQRTAWKRLLAELPPLPTGLKRRMPVLLPYTGPQTMKSRNGENPELYAVYPFRLFGLTKPDLEMAIATFNARRCRQKGCWVQDPIQAAMLGLADIAKDYTAHALLNKAPKLKFPAFWSHGCDYMPDQDNGGNGENGLQNMLLGYDGRRILVLPAWPKEWDVDFKLNAPFRTTVEGRFEHGMVTRLVVTPAERRADVVECWKLPPWVEPVRPVPGKVAGMVTTVLVPGTDIAAVINTVAGGATQLMEHGGNEGVGRAIDGSLETKFYNSTQGDGTGNAGFVLNLVAPTAVNAFQLAPGNDMPGRDPLAITIEGSNDPDAAKAGGKGFVVLYDGLTGIDTDPGRNQWGPAITFANAKAYKVYRVLVSETRATGSGPQLSEFRLGTVGR